MKNASPLRTRRVALPLRACDPRHTPSPRHSAPSRPLEYTGILLQAGQDLTLDMELQPAGVSEAVTVVGDAPSIDLSSARMGVNVSEREVEDLPVNGRQMSQLMLQAPGALNSGTGTCSDIRFSGRAVEQNVIRYDGIEGSAIIDAAPGNLNGEIPSPFKLQASLENVQEFRVESSSYPAEYGTGTGGQISVVTKSGGNTVHGSPFDYVRDDKFDSQELHSTSQKSPLSPEAVRRLRRRADREGPRVLLRQLRRLSAGRRHQLHRRRAERGGVAARGACDSAAVRRASAPRCGRPARRVGEPRLRHRAAAGDGRTSARIPWPRAPT